jgi:hypothetical protein
MMKFVVAAAIALFTIPVWSQNVELVDPKMEELPQQTPLAKAISDLADESLNGKVKRVVVENAHLSDSGKPVRKVSHVMAFDRGGSFIQQDYYDSRGNPWQITIYGYIDGKRVSKSRQISYDYDPPPPPAASGFASEKRDTRYSYSYEYKYDRGHLTEMVLFSNSGKTVSRYSYKRTGNQIEKLIFSSNGELNGKRVLTLDPLGSVVEEIDFGLQNHDLYGDRRFRYKYEFDKQGNWIKKEALVEVTKKGITSTRPGYTQYRTLIYY